MTYHKDFADYWLSVGEQKAITAIAINAMVDGDDGMRRACKHFKIKLAASKVEKLKMLALIAWGFYKEDEEDEQ